MPLFVCSECHAIENTAIGHYWSRHNHERDPEKWPAEPLCSGCMPEWMREMRHIEGDWHGQFPKVIAEPRDVIRRRDAFVWWPEEWSAEINT